MTVDFNKVHKIDRTGDIKYNPYTLESIFGREVLPFWIAETDFKCPPAILESLNKMTDKASYGYQFKTDELKDCICRWFINRHQLSLDPSNLLFTSSVMAGLAAAIDEFSDEGDGVIIQPPVYQEFKSTIVNLDRKVVKNPLIEVDGKYSIDFDDLEEKATIPANKILLICSPHNPVGRVWTYDEMQQMLDICVKTNTLLLSDEIHADIILGENTFTGVMALGNNAFSNAIMFGSPGKTFGIPGISDSFMYVADESMHARMKAIILRFHLGKNNAFTNAATIAGYTHDGPWLDDFLRYIEGNMSFIQEFLVDKLPEIPFSKPQGTYQVWLDFRKFELDVHALKDLLAEKAGIGLNAGYGYGREGAGFARMNIATQKSMIQEGLERIKMALNS